MPTALSHGPAAVLWAICDAVVDQYESVTGSIEADVDAIETAVFGASCTSEAERIYMLKREVLEMRRAMVPLREPIERFARADALHVDWDAAVYFRNVAGHVARVCEQTDSLDKLLGSALDAHIARVSVQQNDDMRRISAWIAIALGPTVVCSIYGMNFQRMPELHWRYGYFMVLSFIAAGCIALYASFRRSGWFEVPGGAHRRQGISPSGHTRHSRHGLSVSWPGDPAGFRPTCRNRPHRCRSGSE